MAKSWQAFLDRRLKERTLGHFTSQDEYLEIVENPEEFKEHKYWWCHNFINRCFKVPPEKDQRRKAKSLLKKFEQVKSNPPEGEFNITRKIIESVTLYDLLKSFDDDFAYLGGLMKANEADSPLFQMGALLTGLAQTKKNVVMIAIDISSSREK